MYSRISRLTHMQMHIILNIYAIIKGGIFVRGDSKCYLYYCSVSVSVLTIKGTDCDLVHLGEVANLSGGNVQ